MASGWGEVDVQGPWQTPAYNKKAHCFGLQVHHSYDLLPVSFVELQLRLWQSSTRA